MKKQSDRRADRPRRAGKGQPPSYLEETHRPGLIVALILPLVVLYQIGIVQSGYATRNIAEVWMMRALGMLGIPAAGVINALTLVALIYALWKLRQTGPISFGFIAAMVLESTLYAVLIFRTVAIAAAVVHRNVESFLVLDNVPWTSLWLSIGAGVYEELLFRLFLVGGGVMVLQKVFRWNKFWSCVAALIVSSLLFSAAHHVSPAGEQFNSFVFIFRALCGLGLGTIFITRGLGIAVWTHAIYNVLVLWTRP